MLQPARRQYNNNNKHNKRASTLLAQAVSAKLEDGNLKAAIRIISSDESPAQPAAESLQRLQMKHPPGSAGMADLPDVSLDSVFSVSEEQVCHAVLSFPAGSSGGPDGMHP